MARLPHNMNREDNEYITNLELKKMQKQKKDLKDINYGEKAEIS